MTVKLAILRSGEDIISDVKELVTPGENPEVQNVIGYMLNKPHKVVCSKKPIFVEDENDAQSEFQITLSPWIVLSKDEQIPIRPDWVVTIVEPVSILKEMYEEKVNGQNSKDTSIDE